MGETLVDAGLYGTTRDGGRPDLNQADGIHPNAAGERIMTDTVWKTLEPLLKK